MSALLDSLLTPEQRASCAIHDTPVEWVQPAEACTELGHKELPNRFPETKWVAVIGILALLAAWWQVG